MRLRRLVGVVWAALLLAAALWPSAAVAQDTTRQDATAITSLVDAMAQAAINQDAETYLSYVDLSDPVFAREHTYWVRDWETNGPPDKFMMSVTDIEVKGDEAVGTINITWTQAEAGTRRAQYSVRFVLRADGVWLYAGEFWITTQTDQFVIHAAPGRDSVAGSLAAILPGIYNHVTASLGYEPSVRVQIKLFASQEALGASVALSLPPFRGWNEPGESLRLFIGPGEQPSPRVIAHEFTHFVTFDMADTSRGAYPWWLMEGIAEYAASAYWDETRRFERFSLVRQWSAEDALAPWDQISDFEATPVDLWQNVYPQGYVFVVFVTETYGEQARNDWLWEMARQHPIEDATQAVFEMSFDELDQAFRAWLAQ
jgi:hypothetical protein